MSVTRELTPFTAVKGPPYRRLYPIYPSMASAMGCTDQGSPRVVAWGSPEDQEKRQRIVQELQRIRDFGVQVAKGVGCACATFCHNHELPCDIGGAIMGASDDVFSY